MTSVGPIGVELVQLMSASMGSLDDYARLPELGVAVRDCHCGGGGGDCLCSDSLAAQQRHRQRVAARAGF